MLKDTLLDELLVTGLVPATDMSARRIVEWGDNPNECIKAKQNKNNMIAMNTISQER
jgi:hypothetical protein